MSTLITLGPIVDAPPALLSLHAVKIPDRESKEVDGEDISETVMVCFHRPCTRWNLQAHVFGRHGTGLKILKTHSTGMLVASG